jgi:hypothetical protein
MWAFFILGLPVAVMSRYIVQRLYRSGRLRPNDDFRTLRKNVGNIKKRKGDEAGEDNFAQQKWMKFGGGFYGITAFTTWIMIELGEALSFVGNLSVNISGIFENGIGSFIIGFFVNQLQNFVSALIWFTYWTDDDRSMLVWVAVPYVAYLAGLFVAGKSWSDLMQIWNEVRNPHERESNPGGGSEENH